MRKTVIQLSYILCSKCKINSNSDIWIFVEIIVGYWINGNLFHKGLYG